MDIEDQSAEQARSGCCSLRCCGKVSLGIALVLFVFFIGPRRGPPNRGQGEWLFPDRPAIIAHGNCPCLPHPSNTLQYFDFAHQQGVDAFEIDLMLTSDDVLICFHDKDYDHLSDATGVVRDLPYEWALANVDVSGRYPEYDNVSIPPPTLEELLTRFASTDLLFNLEIKTEERYSKLVAEKVCELVTRLGLLERSLVASFNAQNILAVRETCNVATSAYETEGYMTMPLILFNLDRWWWTPGDITALQMPMSASLFDFTFDLTEKYLIDRIHQHGVAHNSIWVNDRESMEKLIDSGSDGLITDDIPLLRQVLQDKGKELPSPGRLVEVLA